MKSTLLFCYICLLTFPSNWVLGQPIRTSGITTLHVTTENLAGNLSLTAQIYHVFPSHDFSELDDSLSISKTQTWLRCPLRVSQNVFLTIGQDQLTLWLMPGDTLHIHVVSLDLPLIKRYRFRGSNQAEQEYYLAKQAWFVTDPGQAAMKAGAQTRNLGEFRHQIDSLTRSENLFWQQYQQAHPLPARFVRFESDAIRYRDAELRLYMSWYQPDHQQKKQHIPADYFAFLDHIAVRNASAQYDYEYLKFLHEYLAYKMKTSGKGAPTDEFQHQLANQLLGHDLGGFFRLWKTSYRVQNNPEQALTELSANGFPVDYQYLVVYLKQRSAKKAKVLARGDKAPGFFLPDTRDSLISLSQFKGQAVYLCFWYTTCGGCHYEFPHENRLVDQFRDQPVQIVSICTFSKPDKWREAIKKVGLKTVNLFANPEWQKTLEEKYAISVYPHYVLIDADGRIVENFATRPSQNAAAKIKQVVAKVEPK